MTPRFDLGTASAKERLRFAQQVRPIRNTSGMTQQELADAAGVDRRTISNIERARFAPQADVLRRVFTALGVATEEDTLSPDTEQYLAILGPLIEAIDQERRGTVVNQAVVLFVDEIKGEPRATVSELPVRTIPTEEEADALGAVAKTEVSEVDEFESGSAE